MSQMHRLRRLASFLVLPLLSGCWLFGVDQGYHKDSIGDGSYWMNYDATRRGGLLVGEKDKGARVLAEPAPDAIASTAINFVAEASAKAQQVEGKVDVEYSRTVAELAGRSQTVLVVREALYRLNELYMNGALGNDAQGKAEVADLYKSSMNAVVLLALASALSESGAKEAAAAQARQLTKAEEQASEARAQIDALEKAAPTVKDIKDPSAAKAAADHLMSTAPQVFHALPSDPTPDLLRQWVPQELERAKQKLRTAERDAADARSGMKELMESVKSLGTTLTTPVGK